MSAAPTFVCPLCGALLALTEAGSYSGSRLLDDHGSIIAGSYQELHSEPESLWLACINAGCAYEDRNIEVDATGDQIQRRSQS